MKEAETARTEALPDTCCVVRVTLKPSSPTVALHVIRNFFYILVQKMCCVVSSASCNWTVFWYDADRITVCRFFLFQIWLRAPIQLPMAALDTGQGESIENKSSFWFARHSSIDQQFIFVYSKYLHVSAFIARTSSDQTTVKLHYGKTLYYIISVNCGGEIWTSKQVLYINNNNNNNNITTFSLVLVGLFSSVCSDVDTLKMQIITLSVVIVSLIL
jgi:hypothetical protein